MSKLEQLIHEHCSEGVSYRSIAEIGTLRRGKRFVHADVVENSGIPCIHYGELYTYYGVWTNNTKSFVRSELASKLRYAHNSDVVIVGAGENDTDIGIAVAYLGDKEIAVHDACYIWSDHKMNPKYLSYCLRTKSYHNQIKKYVTTGKICAISAENIGKAIIPIPPIEIQDEIVRILDDYAEKNTQLTSALHDELKSRKKQYEYYLPQVFEAYLYNENVQSVTINDVCIKTTSGGTPKTTHSGYYGGTIPWLRTQEINWSDIYDTEIKITQEGLDNSSAKFIPSDCVIVAMYGATAAKTAINRIPLTTNQACCNLEINAQKAIVEYVYLWLIKEYKKLKSLGRGSQHNLNAEMIKSYPIIIPNLEIQKAIVDKANQLETATKELQICIDSEISLRILQYNYFRDKLLSFT